jgi:hypothetical protein
MENLSRAALKGCFNLAWNGVDLCNQLIEYLLNVAEV